MVYVIIIGIYWRLFGFEVQGKWREIRGKSGGFSFGTPKNSIFFKFPGFFVNLWFFAILYLSVSIPIKKDWIFCYLPLTLKLKIWGLKLTNIKFQEFLKTIYFFLNLEITNIISCPSRILCFVEGGLKLVFVILL